MTASPPVESPVIETEEVAVRVPTIKFPAVVEARYARFAYSVPVEVALVALRFVKVCVPVQEFAFVRLSEATTAPTFGEIVSVPSALVTLETPVTRHVPLYARQPVARLSPPPKDEVAEPVVLMPLVLERPSVLMPPAKVEVAVEVDVTEPVVREPVVTEPEVRVEKTPEIDLKMFAKSEVLVAFVVVAFPNV